MFDVEYLLTCWAHDTDINQNTFLTKLKLKFGAELHNHRSRQIAQLKWQVNEYQIDKKYVEILMQREANILEMLKHLKGNRLPPYSELSYELLVLDVIVFQWYRMRFVIKDDVVQKARQRINFYERKLTKEALSIFEMQQFLSLSIIDEAEESIFLRGLSDRGFL